MRHPAFQSGDFDTNFVKHYFENPKVMWEMFKDENSALEAGISQVWKDLTDKTNKNAASREITSTWKLHAH
ncbi:hypothetical protein D3C85_1872930 [compost metagenome]